jgi:hypothetical protein
MPTFPGATKLQKLFTPAFRDLPVEQQSRIYRELLDGKLTFKAAVKQGSASMDSIDDWVDFWHESPVGCKMFVFLGFNNTEYDRWVKSADALASIINA